MRSRPLVLALAVLIALAGWVWRSEQDPPEHETVEPALARLFPDADVDQVTRLSIHEGARQQIMERDPADPGSWLLITQPPRPASAAHVLAAVRALSSLSSRRSFAAVGERANYGISEITPRVVLEGQSGVIAEVLLGATLPIGTARYVQIPGAADVHVVDAKHLLPLVRDPLEFRDMRVLALGPGDVGRLAITRRKAPPLVIERDPHGRFFLDGGPDSPRYRADRDAVNDLILELLELKARRVASSSESPGGTDAPAITVELLAPDGRSLTLLIGREDVEGDRYALASGELLPRGVGGELVLIPPQTPERLSMSGKALRSEVLLDFDPDTLVSMSWSVRGVSRELTRPGTTWQVVGEAGERVDEEALSAALRKLARIKGLAFVDADSGEPERGVETAQLRLVDRAGAEHGLRLLRGPTSDHAAVEGESVLREVDDELSDVLSSLLGLVHAGAEGQPAGP
jgi:hypothetical protein